MNLKILIKKNISTIIIIILIIFFIAITTYEFINLKSNNETAIILQFSSVLIALIIGIISAVSSWNNNNKLIRNNEIQLKIVEKYELLLELNIKIERFKLQSKNFSILKETMFNEEDCNSYLTLIEIQNILENNRDVFLLLFPKTLLNYTQFKFKFSENIRSVLPDNKSNKILIGLFSEIFNKTEHGDYPFFDLNLIEVPEMVESIFPKFKFIIQYQKDIDIEDYHKGLRIYFNELNKLIKQFNKEFEEQKIKYELY